MERKIELGWKVRDRMTGFVGTATASAEYLNGNCQILVEVLSENGKGITQEWLDQGRLKKAD